MTNEEVTNEINCFKVDGAVEAQSMLPDISDFSLADEADVKVSSALHFKALSNDLSVVMVQDGHECQKWAKVETIGDKVNRYTMWLKYEDDIAVPIHYEMKGYNTLLGSHYDHYFVSYKHFKAKVLDDSHVFDIYTTENCHGWPGPSIDHTYTMNPMREFIDNDDSHVTNTFEDFKDKHNRNYESDQEHTKRLELYRQNLRFIHSKNRQALSFSLASNHLADREEGEMAALRGRTHDSSVLYNGGLPQQYTQHQLRDIPAELDWR